MLPLSSDQQHPVIRFRRAEAVDAANAGDDDHVAPLDQRTRSPQSRSVSISSLIDASFSMYDVARRNVGFGLVVVVVADEVLDRVVREEAS